MIRTLESVCAKLEDPHKLQELLPWLLELFVQRSLEIQKLCERDKLSLKDQAGNLGNNKLKILILLKMKLIIVVVYIFIIFSHNSDLFQNCSIANIFHRLMNILEHWCMRVQTG